MPAMTNKKNATAMVCKRGNGAQPTGAMPRFLFTCAYDGAPWRGWQSQAGGLTVQDCIEEALARILHSPVRISAAGRTDAGVHALDQHFHLDPPPDSRMDAHAWRAALNAHLPASVRIMAVRPVSSQFHARFSAIGKIYEYRIWLGPVLPPHLAGRAWHHPHPLDQDLLRQALACYCGEHDFRLFAARRGNEPALPPADYYMRTIYSATCHQEGDLLSLRFHGNGFMYRMVRLLVGSACRVAAGRAPLQSISQALQEPATGRKTRYCAPAGGLYLLRVLYPPIEEA